MVDCRRCIGQQSHVSSGDYHVAEVHRVNTRYMLGTRATRAVTRAGSTCVLVPAPWFPSPSAARHVSPMMLREGCPKGVPPDNMALLYTYVQLGNLYDDLLPVCCQLHLDECLSQLRIGASVCVQLNTDTHGQGKIM